MILAEAIEERFKNELAEMPSWKDLTGSQFVKHLAVFIAWAAEDAAFKIERARHEAFIDTAINRSSILAHGEGMEFMPRKPVPAEGKVKISNQGDYPFTILRESEFMSDSQTVFVLVDTVVNERANRDITGLITGMEATGQASTTFCAADNSFHEVTLAQLKTMLLEIIQHGQAVYAAKWRMRTAIESAAALEALEAVKISFADV